MSYEFMEIKEITEEAREEKAVVKKCRKADNTSATSKEKPSDEFRNGKMVIAEGCEYSLDDYSTMVSNNALIAGSVGCGKTRNIASANIYEAKGSYVITDPKGNLCKKYGDYLRRKGYDVKLVDFTNPAQSVKYNPFSFIRNTQDILKIAATIIDSDKSSSNRADPFWDNNATILLCALIGYLYEMDKLNNTDKCSISEVMKLMRKGVRKNEDTTDSPLSRLFSELQQKNPCSWACEQFESVNSNPTKTYNCVKTTLSGKFSAMDTPELREMFSANEISFRDIADRKTAVFVTVSDTDRSMDVLVNLFFTQAMNELCNYADTECEDNRLPVPVRFILDDFATNCKIEEFPRMISSFRSRAISVMLMIQAESQLSACYGDDAYTIIANCDTYAYLGGNDLYTQRVISERCDRPFNEVAAMPVGHCWVFRRGDKPVFAKLKDTSECIREMLAVREKESGIV